MKKRTIEDIDIEIEELDDNIDDLKGSISEDGPAWREEWRGGTRDLAPGYIPLADRRKKVERLESKKARLLKERAALVAKQVPSSGKRYDYGKLSEKVLQLVKRDGCMSGRTVPSKRILTWLKEIKRDGYTTTEGAIRAVLSTHGFSKEPPGKS
jgi:hypothetical protein